ncbi:MAG: maleylacetoacetate isomerase [Alphaproteobacteria bacterium]
MKYYGYFRSSAAYRLRIALALKGLDCDFESVHLTKDGGRQHTPEFKAINPQGLVPTLVTDSGNVLTQSLALMEYLDETHPEPPFLPADALGRARVRAFAQAIACDIHPLNNLRILQYIKRDMGLGEEAKNSWYRHWIDVGFKGLEAMLAGRSDRFCFGDRPGLADICLVPQVSNAQRFDCDMSAFPRCMEIAERCNELPEFANAAPGKQPDAE